MACCDHEIVYYYFQWNKSNNTEDTGLTLLGPVFIKINTVSANFNNTRPSLILNIYREPQRNSGVVKRHATGTY